MKYQVYYLLNGEEGRIAVDADTAALAAQEAQEQATAADTAANEQFELIQVQLIDEVDEYTTPANDANFDPE